MKGDERRVTRDEVVGEGGGEGWVWWVVVCVVVVEVGGQGRVVGQVVAVSRGAHL